MSKEERAQEEKRQDKKAYIVLTTIVAMFIAGALMGYWQGNEDWRKRLVKSGFGHYDSQTGDFKLKSNK